MPTCINLDLDLSQIGLPIPEAAIERENMSFTYNWKIVSPVLKRLFSYLQVMRKKKESIEKQLTGTVTIRRQIPLLKLKREINKYYK